MPISNVIVGVGTKIWHEALVNLYNCKIGSLCSIGAFVEIGDGVVIGDRVRIGAHAFIPGGVTIEDDAWIGPRVTFTNDKVPPSAGRRWMSTLVKKKARIGAAATILPGVTLWDNCLIGAGAVVTKDVEPGKVVVGVPARYLAFVEERHADH